MCENPGIYKVLKLVIYLSSYLDQESAKKTFRSSSQAATCYYHSNHLTLFVLGVGGKFALPPGFFNAASKRKIFLL